MNDILPTHKDAAENLGRFTKAYAARRTQDGKSARDIKRCLKRAIAREVYRLMNTHAAAVARSLPMTA